MPTVCLEQAKLINDRIRSTYEQLLRKHGSLYLHLSGEGKVSFNNGHAWLGFIQTCFDGDMGCLQPSNPDFNTCAKTMLFSYLRKLIIGPHLNMTSLGLYVPDEDDWNNGLQMLSDIMEETPEGTCWNQEIVKEGEVVATLTIKAVSNPFITGLWVANHDAEYITQIEQIGEHPNPNPNARIAPIDQWEIPVLDGNGETHLLTKENTLYLVKDMKTIGGYHLLKDNQSGKYFVIDEDDYYPQ